MMSDAPEVNSEQNQPDEADRLAQPVDNEHPPRLPFLVVGIGASAGGLEAISDFLTAVRPDSGMAFVFVQHLSPSANSMLAEILEKRSPIPVRQVEDGMIVEPNHLYVIRPGHTLIIHDGKLRLGESLMEKRNRRPVDDFFRSLAEEQRERAIGVILSGMGSNGAAGAQAIKAVGGLCIAQDPETAQYPSMPRHLIDAGYADFILNVAEIPDRLLTYAGHSYAKGERIDLATFEKQDQQYVSEILAIVRTRTRQDFTGYKKATILRRIQRRMGLNRITAISEYTKFLRENAGEVTALADDLLIHVTGFFRDEEAWENLHAQVIAPLVATREKNGSIRCWVTACSSGEEAYSLAMLLTEEMETANKELDIKVFATDMADRTLQNARTGIFPGGIESEISPERLERFFQKEDAVYRVRQDLREKVIFAPQNVLQDPPFSRLDIITCRNLLIYLEPEVQRRILGLLHFGLRDGGVLFLGKSEHAGADDWFEPVDKKARIYRRVGPTRHRSTEFPLPPISSHRGKLDLARPIGRSAAVKSSLASQTDRTLLEHHTPAALTIDRNYKIVYFHGNTERYLSTPRGEPTRDLMALVRPFVRGTVRTAVQRAAATHTVVAVPDGWIETSDGQRRRVVVTASPLDLQNPGDFFVISFTENVDSQPVDSMTANVGELHVAELNRLRDDLQGTIEELQGANEDLKVSHEEVVSTNEELQSANEELETSREEMQSLNEELSTVNSQLHAKMEEHEATSNDLQSLLTSTNIAVLFLDPKLRIRRFTPQLKQLIDVIASDVGRPLSALEKQFTDPDLIGDAEAVLSGLVPIEREIAANNGRWYERRVLPYRTTDNRIDGVVVTFFDVTERRLAKQALQASDERMTFLLKMSDLLRRFTDADEIMREATSVLGEHLNASHCCYVEVDEDGEHCTIRSSYSRDVPKLAGRYRMSDLGKRRLGELRVGQIVVSTNVREDESLAQVERDENLALEMGSYINVPLMKEDQLVAVLAVSCVEPREWTATEVRLVREIADRTWATIEHARSEATLREMDSRQRLLVENAMDFAMIMTDPQGKVTFWNEGAEKLLGFTQAEAMGMDSRVIFTEEDQANGAPEREMAQAIATGRAMDVRWHQRKDKSRFWGNGVMRALRNPDDSIRGFAKIMRDETVRKQAELAMQSAKEAAESANRLKDEFLATLSHELRTPLGAILLWSKLLEREQNKLPSNVRDGLSAIRSSAEAQKELIEDLLDLSRVTTGKMRMNMREAELIPVLRDAIDAISPTAGAKDITIKTDLDDRVGIVRFDPDRIRQVIWNLLSNAVKFTPAGGLVSISARRTKGAIVLEVKDTGDGMSATLLDRVFERFQQGDRSQSDRTSTGLGLGLAIAKELVELHGGSITAFSEGVGKGSTFTIQLPVSSKPLMGHSVKSTVPDKPRTESLKGKNVLLVEDDPATRKAIVKLLQLSELEVCEADSMSDALLAYGESVPDYIISDLGLKNGDGFALIREIRRLEAESGSPQVPAIAITAFIRQTDRETAMQAGFQHFLSKPIEPDLLMKVLCDLNPRS